MSVNFRGAGVALITPFLPDQQIDFEALTQIVEQQISNGIDYLVVLGTTAETATLNEKEKQLVIDHVTQIAARRLPIVVGVGGNNTAAVTEQLRRLDLSKADALLSVVPYYSKPSQEGIFQHYMAIAEASPLPIILYNVPGRTSVSMSAETTVRLANSSSKFIGTKEASGNLAEITKILLSKPSDFLLISGDDALTVPIISLGGDGVISVAANAIPGAVAQMTHCALEGNFNEAALLHQRIHRFCEALFMDGNPAGVKAALQISGIIKNVLRLPLVPVTERTYQIISEELSGLK